MSRSCLDIPISRHVWETRYRLTREDGSREQDIDDSWRRVAHSIAAGESDPGHWSRRFHAILNDCRFLPGGRILAGAGSGRRVTLLNCFVMGVIEDDMESIFDRLKEGALTMQAGGGVGYDFSTLRPRGSEARASGRIASGPVSFMQIWDAMCATVMSTDARRGAMIGSLRCDHPDIMDFIDAKRTPGALQHFNLSVQITDAFMHAVERDRGWPLVFPAAGLTPDAGAGTLQRRWSGSGEPVTCRVLDRIPARTLWRRMMEAAYYTAEPGVLFIDRINRENNLHYREWITTTNPCGEIPLPPYGACDLGSLNLPRFVLDPFTDAARLDWPALEEVAAVAVRLLDDVIDHSWFPLPVQAAEARGSRRIGLGITGLADTLIMLGLHYAAPAARTLAASIMERLRDAAYRASIALAREKGAFPRFRRDAYLEGAFVRRLPESIRQGIADHGIRNSHLLAIAPTGTISLLAGNVSSGIEPVFDFRYRRRVLDSAGKEREFEVEDYAHRLWRERNGGALPDSFVEARALDPADHLAMQAALQPYVDNAISKTINVPESYPFERFRSLYREAFRLGLKGCTTFRPTSRQPGILLAPDQGVESGSRCCSIERAED
ncbi:MAG TPA: adenosylcobalamin-dependent ribonucleoside-diphosphate reductase [Sedimenticola thiotaurini]|uniref:Vitamin B12-dependent ribonucleotide reductase n=1 Tax=Sedimenticola thiotaurini TaxID=1543721 RepID=A0A831RJX4_9GAMM|nr:adenosylcobalamin-dependent ribonucleoside-diphosphate reductase [Sedimenticola thiotaurini]